MPLVRYEVRCEHRLANPELFRSAARDDPEGLLEGVAVAGLIGIVRQLGDLAEFAAEVFRDLHDELTKVGGRAFDLTVRLHQLEAELPSVENALLSEPNQLRFAYTNGADWHASIRSDQNHCTSGELPRFVRNFYEECRGPPRLFLLDKFDVAGSGACLKRYTDPSFFKLEWARSELMKAQRAQRDKKARREKKKGRRRKTGQAIAAINQIPARVRYGSASLEDLDTLSHLLASTLKDEVSTSSSHQSVNYGPGTLPQKWSNLVSKGKVIGDSLPPTGASAPQPVIGASKPLKISAKDIEANISGNIYRPCERESVAESMAGKISKIIETRDRSAVPSAGRISREVDDETPKGANGSRTPAADAEIIETRDRDAVPSAGLISMDVDDEIPKGANGSRIPAADAEIIETRDRSAVPSVGLISRDMDDETPKGANGSRPPAADAEIIETRDRDAVPSAGLISMDVDDEIPKGANGSRIPAADAEIIETRDRSAVPSVGLISRDMDDETPKGANGSRPPAADAEIIETRDRDAVPSAGQISMDIDDEIPKGANGSRIPAADAETKVTNRAAKNDLEAGTMARAGRTSRGTSSSNASMDYRGGSNLVDWGASQTSVPAITPRSNVAVNSTEGSKPANARASRTSMPDVSPMDSIILSSPTVQPTQGPLEQAKQNAPPSFRVEDDDSPLSSPTGSVIIKDTPSLPGSPASDYSECESAIPEFFPPYDQPKSPVSPRSVAHALEDSVKHRKTSSGEMRVRDPRFVLSQSVAASAVSTQEGGPWNFESEMPDHVHSFPENRVEAPPSHTPAQHDTAHEETSLHAALPPTPHLDSGPNRSLQSTEAATPGAVSIWATPNSQDSSASNSPLDSPPRKRDLARADEGHTSEWRGRSQPDSTSGTGIIRVPDSPCRSPSNSPPTSPPKFSDQSNFLRWKGRSEISTIKTDYALPPNLVCLSETSSPPCSPPQSHGGSPKQWDQRSEVLSSSDSSESSDSTEGIQHGAVEVYRLPDSPLPLDSPAMSEGGDSLSGSSSKSESDEEVDDADENEHEDEHANEVELENEHGHKAERGDEQASENGSEQGSEQGAEQGAELRAEQGAKLGAEHRMLQTSTSESVLENPSNFSSDKSSFEIPSSESKIPNGSIQPSDAQFRPSTFDTLAGPVLPVSLSQRNSTLTPTAGDETNPILNIDPALPPAALRSTDTSASKNALAAAIAHHDWNMMKALTFKDPGNRPFPPPDERSILLEQMRTESATLYRSGDGMERNDHITRPSANINVAAILEKANAIRQAFVGSDDEDGDGGDWSDS